MQLIITHDRPIPYQPPIFLLASLFMPLIEVFTNYILSLHNSFYIDVLYTKNPLELFFSDLIQNLLNW